MKKVILFGLNDFAELAYFYLVNDSEYEVFAFCVNEKYLPLEKVYKGLPVVAFEEIENIYSPSEYLFFVPMSPRNMNISRKEIYLEAKKKGYNFISYISSKATVLSNKIGENCFILEDNTIQPFVEIGNNVMIWSGNHIGHHSKIKDHIMFTSHVVLSGHCIVESNSVLGVNATIRDGVIIAEGTFVGMGATITQDTEKWKVYVGCPAKPIKNSL